MSLYVFTCRCGKEVRGDQGAKCPGCGTLLYSQPQVTLTPPKWAIDAARAVEESKKP